MLFSKALSSPPARAAYFSGIRDTFIVIPSYLPFGLVCGLAAVNAGLTTSASVAMPVLVYGGSSQAVLLQQVPRVLQLAQQILLLQAVHFII